LDERSRIEVRNGKNKRANSDGLLISKTKKERLIQNIKERERERESYAHGENAESDANMSSPRTLSISHNFLLLALYDE
jgi:hypothetical protein